MESARHFISRIDGFVIHTLQNPRVSISLVPELGGRVVSILDRAAGREWLDGWRPEASRRLWRPTDPETYDSGPGAGIDECLPTVLSCRVEGSELPDHGDLWSSPAWIDESAAAEGDLVCRWRLASLPLLLERSITLEAGRVRFRYRLENLADMATPFLWAWHPLFTLEAGDVLRFGEPVTRCHTPDGRELDWPRPHEGWDLSMGHLGGALPASSKVFVGPLSEARAEIRGRTSVLHLRWPASWFPWAGVWITRGAWKNLHHWAIEPTNFPVDRLSEAPPGDPSVMLAEGETRHWELELRLGEPFWK